MVYVWRITNQSTPFKPIVNHYLSWQELHAAMTKWFKLAKLHASPQFTKDLALCAADEFPKETLLLMRWTLHLWYYLKLM
jgi:hypothetical protein